MDYLTEARRFVLRAREAINPEVVREHLKIAEWYLSREIEERDVTPAQGSDSPDGAGGQSRRT